MIDRTEEYPLEMDWNGQTATDLRGRNPADWKLAIHSFCGEELKSVEKLLSQVLTSRCESMNQISSQAAALGGKRLRPALLILAGLATRQRCDFSVRQRQDLISLACAVELVHAASLVHDDVMDGALLRRHLPTVSSLQGNKTAILLGDYLFTKAYALAATARTNFGARKLAQASTALCEGEMQQQHAARSWTMSVAEYRQILLRKTGALCAVSCQLGAWVVGAGSQHRRELRTFGSQLGLAFQIFDDWLDYWGSDDVGKTLGTDLQEGKLTLPVLRLLAQSSATERLRLEQWLTEASDPDGADQRRAIEEIRGRLDQSDASEYTLGIARKCAHRAMDSLSILPSSPAKELLACLAQFSVARTD